MLIAVIYGNFSQKHWQIRSKKFKLQKSFRNSCPSKKLNGNYTSMDFLRMFFSGDQINVMTLNCKWICEASRSIHIQPVDTAKYSQTWIDGNSLLLLSLLLYDRRYISTVIYITKKKYPHALFPLFSQVCSVQHTILCKEQHVSTKRAEFQLKTNMKFESQ